MAEYTPSEADVRAWCREGTGDYPDVMDEWITRFLARVRRDALAAAEHRATRAEAQSEARRINAEYWKTLAGEHWARIQAVRDVLDEYGDPEIWAEDIRRALDGDA